MKATEFAKIFGISRETLNDYERYKVLHPLTIDGKRAYTAGDMHTLISYIRARRFDMPRDSAGLFFTPSSSISERIQYLSDVEQIYQKRVILDEIKLECIKQSIKEISSLNVNTGSYWIEITEPRRFAAYSVCDIAETTQFEVEYKTFSECMKYVECTESEMLFSSADPSAPARWAFSMHEKHAEKLSDSIFCSSPIRPESYVLTTAISISSYRDIRTYIDQLILEAGKRGMKAADGENVIVKPVLYAPEDNKKVLCKIELIVEIPAKL